jgi:very-short-patch-repair endonuclease
MKNEALLLGLLNDAFPRQWKSEYKGIEGRKFRFDAANPSAQIAVEIEGAIWMGNKGGHTTGIGYTKDMEKYNLATLEGWRILRYSPAILKKTPEKIIEDVRKLI